MLLGDRVTVRNIVDAKNMVVDWEGESVWGKGMSTANLVDGKVIHPDGIFKYVGTKQSTNTAGGNSTVYRIERVGDD